MDPGQPADPDFLAEAWRSALESLDLTHFDGAFQKTKLAERRCRLPDVCPDAPCEHASIQCYVAVHHEMSMARGLNGAAPQSL